jgi:hypothetical protein
MVAEILGDAAHGKRCFGNSMYEQMWHQRKRRPDMRIPYIAYRRATLLMKKGAETWEGIFRLPGNLAHVKEMADALNRGDDPLTDVSLNDLASLFKSWFGDLPIPLVPPEAVARLTEIANGSHNFVEFLATLPPLHTLVLTFLIGFLQKLSIAQEVTKMNARNLAICFAPNVVSSAGVAPEDFGKHAETAARFVTDLIEKLDTAALYPTPMGGIAASSHS